MSINASGGDRIKIAAGLSGSVSLPADLDLFYQFDETLTVTPGENDN